jgi:hypothetical protein
MNLCQQLRTNISILVFRPTERRICHPMRQWFMSLRANRQRTKTRVVRTWIPKWTNHGLPTTTWPSVDATRILVLQSKDVVFITKSGIKTLVCNGKQKEAKQNGFAISNMLLSRWRERHTWGGCGLWVPILEDGDQSRNPIIPVKYFDTYILVVWKMSSKHWWVWQCRSGDSCWTRVLPSSYFMI